MKKTGILACLMALVGLSSIGCQPTTPPAAKAPANAHDDHDHGHEHAHAETLADGMTQLTEHYAAIKSAFEAGKPDDAHEQLHDIGHLLEDDLPGLLDKSELDADAKTKAKAACETMFGVFGKLDQGAFHSGEKIDFAEIDKAVAPAMEELKGLVK